jgi:hypothetical protein
MRGTSTHKKQFRVSFQSEIFTRQQSIPSNHWSGLNMAATGLNGTTNHYSIPEQTQKIFNDGILNNPLIAPTLPKGIEQCTSKIRFEGSDKPSIPINWRFAESISALKGLEAALTNVLLREKYGVEPLEAVINT